MSLQRFKSFSLKEKLNKKEMEEEVKKTFEEISEEKSKVVIRKERKTSKKDE